jgi:hypothetical protein
MVDLHQYVITSPKVKETSSNSAAQALHDSPEQALARENLTQMMRARLGEDNTLANRIIPSFGVGCRYELKRIPKTRSFLTL